MRVCPSLALASLVVIQSSSLALCETKIDPVNKYAYGANIGWVDWRGDTKHGAVISTSVCSGYIYSANVGWINLGNGNPANGSYYQNLWAGDFGVNTDDLGNLRGFAYGANIGWVYFEDNGAPSVDLVSGRLSGYIYSANCGWISLSNAFAYVQADTIPNGTLPPGSYTFVPLDAPGLDYSVALGINNAGQIVGGHSIAPAFWTNSSSPVVNLLAPYGGAAIGINDSGQIVGYMFQADYTRRALLWTNTSTWPLDLATFGPQDWPGLESLAGGINSSGQIVGYATGHFQQGDEEFYYGGAAYWPDSASLPYELNGFGRNNQRANAINDSGLAVGVDFSTGSYVATVWTNPYAASRQLENGLGAEALSVNVSGQIVGYNLSASNALFWADYLSPGVVLGRPPGSIQDQAQCINASSQIVGWSYMEQTGDYHAVLWPNSVAPPVDLNGLLPTNSGWVLSKAYGINDSGEIVGLGLYNGQGRAFALISLFPGSSLLITSVLRSGNDFLLTFDSQTAHTYDLLATPDLATGTWTTLQTGIAGNGGSVSVTISNAFVAPHQFFRIKQEQ
jgi:uncharacterized membrane protein